MWKHFLTSIDYLLFEIMEGAYLTAIHDCCLLVLIEWNQATLQNLIPCICQRLPNYKQSILLDFKYPLWLSSYEQLNDSSDSFQFL